MKILSLIAVTSAMAILSACSQAPPSEAAAETYAMKAASGVIAPAPDSVKKNSCAENASKSGFDCSLTFMFAGATPPKTVTWGFVKAGSAWLVTP